MAVHIVTYDLRAPGRDYGSLYDAIKRYPHCHMMDSVWLIEASKDAYQVMQDLSKNIDSNDKMFVSEVSGSWGANRRFECIDWLKEKL